MQDKIQHEIKIWNDAAFFATRSAEPDRAALCNNVVYGLELALRIVTESLEPEKVSIVTFDMVMDRMVNNQQIIEEDTIICPICFSIILDKYYSAEPAKCDHCQTIF